MWSGDGSLEPSSELGQPKHLLMVVVDTQRVDTMGFYNDASVSTPRLDAWAGDAGVVFERAWSQGAYTMASYMAYMTSTHVRTHGLDGDLGPGGICGWDDLTLLPEALAQEGFGTTAFVANSNLHPKKGFPRGFETWNDLEVETQLGSQPLTRKDYVRSDRKVVSSGIAQMKAWSGDEREFLYLHLMAPHLPLAPSRPARKALDLPVKGPEARPIPLKEIRKLRREHTPEDEVRTRQGYQASVWDGDRYITQILDGLEASGHADDTLVVLLSDHGEEIWEHGDYGHQDGVWEQLVHVPLVVRQPGRPAGRVSRPVMLIDVAPTLLELLGLEVPTGWQGHNLFEPEAERLVVTERFDERAATFDGTFKAIWRNDGEGRWRFFDLEKDPTEQRPLAGEGERAQRLKDAALRWALATPEADRSKNRVPSGFCGTLGKAEAEEHMKLLEQLGYVDPDDGTEE